MKRPKHNVAMMRREAIQRRAVLDSIQITMEYGVGEPSFREACRLRFADRPDHRFGGLREADSIRWSAAAGMIAELSMMDWEGCKAIIAEYADRSEANR